MKRLRTTVTLADDLLAGLAERPSPRKSLSERIELDLVRYRAIVLGGMALVRKNLSGPEVRYLAERGRTLLAEPVPPLLWMSDGLARLAHNPMFDESDECESFGIDRHDLSIKLAALGLAEKIALLEYLEQITHNRELSPQEIRNRIETDFPVE